MLRGMAARNVEMFGRGTTEAQRRQEPEKELPFSWDGSTILNYPLILFFSSLCLCASVVQLFRTR